MRLSREEKLRFLRALEEDEEFRLAVAGAIGFREILEELRELRRKSIEQDKRLETIGKKLLEHDKRFEVIERKLLEHDKRFEAIEKKLLEHDEKFRAIMEEIRRIWEEIADIKRRLSHVEDNLGALSESVYAKFFLDMVVYEASATGDRIERWERNARIDDADIDLLITTRRRVYVVEVKVKPRHQDVGALLAKAELVARHYRGREVVPVLSGTRIGREVAEYAASKGVMVVQW